MARIRFSRSVRARTRINNLPDDVLIHILSFLTTKESVATSILSKRWIHLWRHVPNLHFPEINVDSVESTLLFNEFVYSILVSRDIVGSNFINSFHLDIGFGFNNPNIASRSGFPNITKWINLVLQRGLKHLHLDLNHQMKLPLSIFTCRTLVSLSLCYFRVKGFSSNQIQLPSLKSIYLQYIDFSEIKDFVLLLAGCPILEDLQAYAIDFYDDGRDNLTIQQYKSLCFPKLTRARIRSFWYDFPAKVLSNSESVSIDSYLYTNHQVNQLQRPYDDIYIFRNLTHLEIHDFWETAIHVLHLCPKLQNLKLCQLCTVENWDGKDDEESWGQPEFVPQCLLSCLTTCNIMHFLGLQNELLLAEYILKNAQNLQTMTIECESEPLKIERKLSQCPKASATCQLSVYLNHTDYC